MLWFAILKVIFKQLMTDKIKVEIDGDHEDCKSNTVKYQFISYEVLIFECR